MTDAPILTPASIRASLSLASEVVGMHAILDSHEALRTQLADTLNRAVVAEQRVLEADADRADILARRDQVLDDLRQSLEAEIAARKLVEAKLTVAEAQRGSAMFRVNEAASALAERTRERDAALTLLASDETLRIAHARKQAHADGFQAGWHAALLRVREGDSLDDLGDAVPSTATGYLFAVIARAEQAEATLARVREAIERFEAAIPRHYIGCPCLTCSLSNDLRAAITPTAPEPLAAHRSLRPHRFDCDECGMGIPVDEDGCCRGCGADARVVALEEPKGDPR